MKSALHEIFNPAGVRAAGRAPDVAARKKRSRKTVIGLLNNSKPNVAYFLDAVEKGIRTNGYRTVNLTKPRSAGPCPDLEALAERCDYVINAVAD